MRGYKSFGFNFEMLAHTFFIQIIIFFILGLSVKQLPLIAQEFRLSNFFDLFIYLDIILFIICLLMCFNYYVVDRSGIEIRIIFTSIILKKKTWKEIKHYADVKEIWSGEYGSTSSKETVWFIDYNDKVCLRIHKFGRFNFKKVLDIIDKFEDKYKIKLELKDPYLTAFGWKKVIYPEKVLNNEKKKI